MNTTTLLYWFDVIGNLSDVAVLFLVLSICSIIALLIAYMVNFFEGDENPFENKGICKFVKITAYMFFISLLGAIFIPSTKQLYLMYGVGTTIDYLKSNDTAGQIPDKAVKALDAWLDLQNEDKEEKK